MWYLPSVSLNRLQEDTRLYSIRRMHLSMCKGLHALLLSAFLISGCASDTVSQSAAELRLQLGLKYLALGDLTAAQRNLLKAEAVLSQDHRLQLAMARFYQSSGDTQQAEYCYQRAIKLAGSNSYVFNNYGDFLCGLGQYEVAQKQFSRGQHSPLPGVRADSAENAGYCYLNAGAFRLAKKSLISAIRADSRKALNLLTEAEKRLAHEKNGEVRLLLDIYQHSSPASAESLWLEIRFAAQVKRTTDIKRYSVQLARDFPQSIQYQRFLANEY